MYQILKDFTDSNMAGQLSTEINDLSTNTYTITQDVTTVSSTVDRQKARDIQSVRDDLIALAIAFEGKAWLYNSSFTIGKLNESGAITLRPSNDGFDNIFPCILSGIGNIIDTVVEFDISIAILQ